MKKTLITLSLLALIAFSSCAKRYTCPTYLQNTTEEEKDKRVKNTTEEEKSSEVRG